MIGLFPNSRTISADGRWLVFNALGLYRVPLDASQPPHRLHPPLVEGGSLRSGFRVTGNGRVVYMADQLQDEIVELFSSVIAGPTRDLGVRPLRGEASR